MLLVHHVAAYHTTIVIYDDGSILTLADGTDDSLWHTVRIVGITELIRCLLLHIETDDTLVGDGAPEVLVLIHIDDTWDCLNTHAGKILLHVALKTFCLRMIDAVARGRLHKQVAVKCLLDGVDVTIGQRVAVL